MSDSSKFKSYSTNTFFAYNMIKVFLYLVQTNSLIGIILIYYISCLPLTFWFDLIKFNFLMVHQAWHLPSWCKLLWSIKIYSNIHYWRTFQSLPGVPHVPIGLRPDVLELGPIFQTFIYITLGNVCIKNKAHNMAHERNITAENNIFCSKDLA